jgi:hypothetical protein
MWHIDRQCQPLLQKRPAIVSKETYYSVYYVAYYLHLHNGIVLCDMYPPPHTTCILLLMWHVSSSSYDMYPPPHVTCILLLIWHVSSSSYDMYPPPHMTCILLLIWHVSSSSYDMYPPPHMTCILLLIWHVSSSPLYYVAYYLHLHNGIVYPSHLIDFLISHIYYISLCLLTH